MGPLQVDCDLCHRPTLQRLMHLRNVTLDESEDSSSLKDQAEEDRNALGYKLGVLCDIPGKCGQVGRIVAHGLEFSRANDSRENGRPCKRSVCGNRDMM